MKASKKNQPKLSREQRREEARIQRMAKAKRPVLSEAIRKGKKMIRFEKYAKARGLTLTQAMAKLMR